MRRLPIVLETTVFLALALTACAPVAVPEPTATAPMVTATVAAATVTPTPAPAATLPPSPAANGGTDPLPADGLPSAQATVVALAAADLAERTGAAETEIELVLIAADDLPAGDLGCRSKGTPAGVQPGFVTGWVIRLRAAGAEYEYHAHGGQVAYCGAIAAL